MKAVVIYENVEFADRVGAILRRVASRAEINIKWTVLRLSVDELSGKKFVGKALVRARDAHLIVVPAKLAQSIPISLLGWLERWAQARHNGEMALGILDDNTLGRAQAPMHPDLSEFAHKHGLAVIRDGSFLDLERRTAPHIELYRYGNFDQPGTNRSFGIND